MANPNKFTTKEVLNKVLLDSSGNAVTANSVTAQEALNTVLDTTNNRLNMSLAGGTISGDVTISGDLTVSGGGTLAFDEILEGTQVIDVTNTEAFLVRKNSDGGDVFIVDTTNSRVGIGGAPSYALDVKANLDGNVARFWNDGNDGNRDVLLLQGGADSAPFNTRFITFLDGDGGTVGCLQGASGTSNGGLALNITPDTNNLVVDSTGNVGIGGLSDPAYKLEVKSSVTGDWISRIYNTADTSNPNGLLVRVDDPDSTGTILGLHNGDGYRTKFGTSITESANIIDITNTTDASDDSGDTGALRVEGGASIAKKLYVGGSASLENGLTVTQTTSMQYKIYELILTRAGGHLLNLVNASSAIADGNSLGYMRWNGNENGTGEVVGGEISVGAEGDWTNNTDCPTKMSFYTNPGDGVTEYMRLTKDGNLLLNDSILSIYSDDYLGGNYEVITMSKDDGGSGFIKVYKGSSGSYRDLEFQTGGSTRLTIASGGSVTVAGALSKGSGSFKIDHPLESKKDTHHLVHSFVEAPQADNIYRGKVNLSKGTATINIDEVAGMTNGTFVALNREVQCFTSNESDWDAVKGSVSGNILTISCQNENSTATISWLVIGERQDKHMMDTDWTDKDGKVIVEPLKPEEKSTDHVEGKDPLDGIGSLAPNQRPE